MTKYKVYTKGGTVLEVEAEAITSNEAFVHFYVQNPTPANVGSFPVDSIYGFYKSDLVKQANELVVPFNPAK